MTEQKPDADFESLLSYLKSSRAFDFTSYKRTTLMRRVSKRMQAVEIDRFLDYIDYLEVHPDEFEHLFNTILINVTGFFRDPATWDALSSDVIPRLLALKNGQLRIWSAGCSSGEEPFTIAMLFAEAFGLEQYRERVKIYATDVDEEALNQGRHAMFSDRQIAAVPTRLREKYFDPVNDRYAFNKELRRSVIFGRHDLLQDAPISRVCLLVCRNTLMYFHAEAQTKILERFNYALDHGCFLVLGRAEMLLSRTNIFVPIDLKRRVFTKNMIGVDRRAAWPATGQPQSSEDAERMRVLEAALDFSPDAHLVLNQQRVLSHANQRARGLFGLGASDIGRPLQDLDISYRPVELRSLVDQALLERHHVSIKELEWTSPAGETIYLDLMVQPLTDSSGDEIGIGVTFRDVSRFKRLQDDYRASNQELEAAYEELQSTNEELETTNEELQSTVEELETTNEELQSTNEELETMNEELQSTNEELHTANDELTQRGVELNDAYAFQQAVMTSLQQSFIVVDQDLRVQEWNQQSADLWGLRADEVLGIPLFDLDIRLPTDPLMGAIRGCLAGRTDSQPLVLDAVNRRGKSVRVGVRCTPLAHNSRDVRGVIVAMEVLPTPEPSTNDECGRGERHEY
jgi:two-component system, chemotaxis family, CheB/CheR fusion protein